MLDDKDNLNRSESTEENEERSETETECFDKGDSEISQNESNQESRCDECKMNFEKSEDLENHKIKKHPVLMYKCLVGNCLRWFSSRKSRDKHSENLKSRLHKSTYVKCPPQNAIFIEDATQEQLEILKNSTENIRNKGKRGPKPKLYSNENDRDFLIGLPRDQLKRKLMQSVVEKIESTPNKKYVCANESAALSTVKYSKQRTSSIQLSQSSTIIPNGSSPKLAISKDNLKKNAESTNIPVVVPQIQEIKLIPDFSHLKVPLLSLDNQSNFKTFAEDLINLLIIYDPAEYFKYPLIDRFAPYSSQLKKQIDMNMIKTKLKQGYYSTNIENLQNDLLHMYSNGIQCFVEKSIAWNEATKLYQTALVNIQRAKRNFSTVSEIKSIKENSNNTSIFSNSITDNNQQDRITFLNIMNPYNNGKISENEKIMTIGDQLGKLKFGTQNLLGYKEDRRNKVSVLSYLDYGPNFSFGPSYDSGNAYCSKDTSDLLISTFGDSYDYLHTENDLNDIIQDFSLSDNFSLYLMNALTKDILKSYQFTEQNTCDELCLDKSPDLCQNNETQIESSTMQTLLDKSWKDLAQLKSFNYERLTNYQIQPTVDEKKLSEKVTSNLTNLIIKTNPESVTDVNVIRKVLNYK